MTSVANATDLQLLKPPAGFNPPGRLMVFHCTGNAKVLLAFVKKGCVTLAEDVSIEDYRRLVIGGDPC